MESSQAKEQMGIFTKHAKQTNKQVSRSRLLRIERLEQRQMLSVSTADYAAIRAAYSSLDLPEDSGFINIIEIEPDNLSVQSIQDALETAYKNSNIYYADEYNGQKVVDDLIVIRTTQQKNSIEYTSAADQINLGIDKSICGSIYLVAWGDTPLTIDAAEQCSAIALNKTYQIVDTDGNTVAEGTSVAQAGIAGINLTNGNENLGGGIYLVNGSVLTLDSCNIKANSAKTGGGIYLDSSTINMYNCQLTQNSAMEQGGGLYSLNGVVNIYSSTISNNSSEKVGGGIVHLTNEPENIAPQLTIFNSVIAKNQATEFGGAMVLAGDSTIINSTIADNAAVGSAGGIAVSSSTFEMYNSILVSNTGVTYSDLYYDGETTIKGFAGNLFSNSLENNSLYDSSKPLFADASSGDYRLIPDTSQAIDIADLSVVLTNKIAADITGWSRITGNGVDAGAYESRGESDAVIVEQNTSDQLIYTIDEKDNPDSAQIVANVQHGETSLDLQTGEITYTPENGYAGLDTLIFQTTSSEGETQIFSLTILVTKQQSSQLVVSPVIKRAADVTPITQPDAEQIPDSENAVNEWTSFYLELWSGADEIQANASYQLTVTYDSRLYVPTAIVLPDGLLYQYYDFSQPDENNITTLTITVVYDSTYTGKLTAGHNALLGEILFKPTIEYASTDSEIAAAGVAATEIFRPSGISVNDNSANLDIWAVAYDLDDNGKVNMQDFIQFAMMFNQTAQPGTMSDAADFSGDSKVKMDDFILFAMSFNSGYPLKSDLNIPRMTNYYQSNSASAALPAVSASALPSSTDEVIESVVVESPQDAVVQQVTQTVLEAQQSVTEQNATEQSVTEQNAVDQAESQQSAAIQSVTVQSAAVPAQWTLFDSSLKIDWYWKKDRSWGDSAE